MKQCSQCKKTKPESDFGWRNKKRQVLLGICKECKRSNDRLYYQNNTQRREKLALTRKANADKTKQFIQDYKAHRGCAHCGDTRYYVLDFHHPDQNKEYEVSQMHGFSLEKIIREIEKCEVLCANCHREEHHRLSQ